MELQERITITNEVQVSREGLLGIQYREEKDGGRVCGDASGGTGLARQPEASSTISVMLVLRRERRQANGRAEPRVARRWSEAVPGGSAARGTSRFLAGRRGTWTRPPWPHGLSTDGAAHPGRYGPGSSLPCSKYENLQIVCQLASAAESGARPSTSLRYAQDERRVMDSRFRGNDGGWASAE